MTAASLPAQRFACPCCGYRTLDAPARSFAICAVCFWEVDDDEDPYQRSGPMHLSLNEARLNFVTHGACHSHIVRRVRRPEADEIPQQLSPRPRIDERTLAELVARRRRAVERGRQAWQEMRFPGKRKRAPWDTTGRDHLVHDYPQLYDEWLVLFDVHDPLRIGETLLGNRHPDAVANDHLALTYDTQIRWLLPWLTTLTSADALAERIHGEFGRWFEPAVVGPVARFTTLALDAWASYERNGLSSHQPR
jgi:hypothetical protein